MSIYKKRDNTFKIKEVLFLVIVTCIISLMMGVVISKNVMKSDEENQTSTNSALDEFNENYQYIIDNYYDDVDEKKLISGALEGMLNTLGDEYSTIIDDSSSLFNISLNGSYQGIGMVISNDENKNIVVSSIIDDSPAKKAGMQVGDIVKSIDNKDLTNTDYSELSNYVLNSTNSSFNLVVLRGTETIEIKVEKGSVTLKSVSNKIIEKNNKKIGYIYISIFSSNTYEQFKTAVETLEKEKVDGMIIDVRDNTGGHLTTVVNMLSLFLDSKNVIYQTENQDKTVKHYSTGTKTKKYPIVVLQNSNSASASELLSICLQEKYGAKVVGAQSYGKGTVQELITLSNGIEYKFTTKKWLSPNGNWINKKGVTPDVLVELNEDYQNNPTDENDNQLQAAINELLK